MARGFRAVVTVALASVWWVVPVAAQEPPAQPPPDPPIHLVTDYHGVIPGSSPGTTAKKKPAKPTLTWVGFQSTEAGARVFAQTSVSPQVEQTLAGSELVIQLGELEFGEKNNLRPLDCRYFPTDVARVWAKRRGKHAELHVRFKDKTAARKATQQISEEGGLWLVLLDFGASVK
jgi:hypothetical protein